MAKEPPDSLQPTYFDQVYAANADPWAFTTSAYEREKFADTLAHLPRPRYRRGFEVGCSIGVLTAQFANRCDHLLSIDVAERVLQQARLRCALLRNVDFERLQIPQDDVPGTFDLIVVSEVAYYWSRPDLDRAIALLAAHHEPGGHLLLVHWTPAVQDHPLTGDAVHEVWLAHGKWDVLSDERRPQYRISVLERRA